MGTGIPMLCAHCSRPIAGPAVWVGSGPYHFECTQPPGGNATFTVPAVPFGCVCPPTSEQTCQADRCPRRPTKARDD